MTAKRSRIRRVLQFAAWGAAAVMVFDLAMSLASKLLHFPYGWGMIGSIVIYSVLGARVARETGVRYPLVDVGVVATLVALVDASLGWTISWHVGPGKPETPLTTIVWLWTALLVIVVSVVTALLGSLVGRLLPAGGHRGTPP